MCRHVAAVGSTVALSHVLEDAPHALVRQARSPRWQIAGTENPDGWGVAWYAEPRTAPERYRTTTAIWCDDAGLARTRSVTSGVRAVLAAARYATPGFARAEANTAPYVAGPWSFSHNGAVHGFSDGIGAQLRERVSRERRDTLADATDSETLFALALDALDDGTEPASALAGVVQAVCSATTGRLNLLLCDGATITATAFGNSLFARADDGMACVASEPLDDGAGWQRVADGSVVTARPGSLAVVAL